MERSDLEAKRDELVKNLATLEEISLESARSILADCGSDEKAAAMCCLLARHCHVEPTWLSHMLTVYAIHNAVPSSAPLSSSSRDTSLPTTSSKPLLGAQEYQRKLHKHLALISEHKSKLAAVMRCGVGHAPLILAQISNLETQLAELRELVVGWWMEKEP
jgi:hypothetical protein